MDKKKSIKIIKEFAKKLGKEYDIERIIFFGSRATGNYSRDSDIDLIIVSEDFKGINRLQRGVNMYNYWPWIIPVDFICLTKNEFNQLKNKITIVQQAIKEGILFN